MLIAPCLKYATAQGAFKPVYQLPQPYGQVTILLNLRPPPRRLAPLPRPLLRALPPRADSCHAHSRCGRLPGGSGGGAAKMSSCLAVPPATSWTRLAFETRPSYHKLPGAASVSSVRHELAHCAATSRGAGTTSGASESVRSRQPEAHITCGTSASEWLRVTQPGVRFASAAPSGTVKPGTQTAARHSPAGSCKHPSTAPP